MKTIKQIEKAISFGNEVEDCATVWVGIDYNPRKDKGVGVVYGDMDIDKNDPNYVRVRKCAGVEKTATINGLTYFKALRNLADMVMADTQKRIQDGTLWD